MWPWLKKLAIFLSLGLFLIFGSAVKADDNVDLYLFWASGCPHCAKEKLFLPQLEAKYPQLRIHEFEVSRSSENVKLLDDVGAQLGVEVKGVPFTVIGQHYFVGYLNDEVSGTALDQAVQTELDQPTRNIVAEVQQQATAAGQLETAEPGSTNLATTSTNLPTELSLPLVGSISLQSVSLPVMTIVLALLDGFNPCAMWTLLFLISLLLGIKDVRRRWILGVAFIAASALVYFLFLSAWLNLFLLLGFVKWIRVIIGVLAVGAGAYYLRDFWKNRNGGCQVIGNNQQRQAVFARLKAITEKQSLWLALIGIILLAAAVNLVELICSAGLPAIYTQILSLADLPTWQYYAYLLFYIFIFMVDDLFVFFTAMLTLKATGIESKYARYSHLLGGILILIIGILLLVKPEWLMFG